jgi:hypothetical protein
MLVTHQPLQEDTTTTTTTTAATTTANGHTPAGQRATTATRSELVLTPSRLRSESQMAITYASSNMAHAMFFVVLLNKVRCLLS